MMMITQQIIYVHVGVYTLLCVMFSGVFPFDLYSKKEYTKMIDFRSS
jgi:hypothetical protein